MILQKKKLYKIGMHVSKKVMKYINYHLGPFRCDTLFSYSMLKYICSKEPILFQEIKLRCDTLCPYILHINIYALKNQCVLKNGTSVQYFMAM